MAKKKLGNVNIFTGEGMGAVDTSFETFDAQLYGEIAKVDEGRQVAKPISIFDVLPDTAQPRRAIPSVIRQQWDGNPHSIGKLFSTWLDMAQEEKRASLDIATWLEGVTEEEESDDTHPDTTETAVGALEAALMLIVELAASIKRDGLTNPITVAQDDDHFLLETGERRWLAYHLLYANYRDEKWTKIPARVVDQFNVWRQSTENTARADLNAIGKARQFAILMMDLWARESDFSMDFRPITDFPFERSFYAQVTDLRVPRGKSGLLMVAIGAKTRTAFARRRLLLSLPDEAWRLSDDYGLSEDALIEYARLSPDDAVAAVHARIANVPSRNISVTQTSKAVSAEPTRGVLTTRNNRAYLSKVWKLAERAEAGITDFSDKDLDTLAKMRRWLDEVENIVQSRRQERKK